MPEDFLLRGEVHLATIDRVPYVTKSEHGGYPAGTKCFAQRKYPGFNITLEFEDGSTFELPEHYHLEGYETPGEDVYAIEDRKIAALIAYMTNRQWPNRYARDPVI
jgi:hypothetical protein